MNKVKKMIISGQQIDMPYIPDFTQQDRGKVLTVDPSGTSYSWREASGGSNIIRLTREAFDDITTKDPNTLYIIIE